MIRLEGMEGTTSGRERNFLRIGRRQFKVGYPHEFNAAVEVLFDASRNGELPRRAAFPLGERGSGLITVPVKLVKRVEHALTTKGFKREVALKPQS